LIGRQTDRRTDGQAQRELEERERVFVVDAGTFAASGWLALFLCIDIAAKASAAAAALECVSL